MALIVRIDVDRPYGRSPLIRHLLSRFSSDVYLPKIEVLGYLTELRHMLQILNEHNARAYVFFRRCTLPSRRVMDLLDRGGHEIGLHLENSRSWSTFTSEKQALERHIGRPVRAVSKHGSGGAKYGRCHYAPYEPDKYVDWARQSGIRLFLGNLEDPTRQPVTHEQSLVAYPAAFWLEPHWRDLERFPVEWLMSEARKSDVVMLVHPENVLDSPSLTGEFRRIIAALPTKVFPS